MREDRTPPGYRTGLSSKRGRKYARCYLNLEASAARPSRALIPEFTATPAR